MPSIITPVVTDYVVVMASTALGVAANNPLRATLDLRGKFGAVILVYIGRTGTTAPAASIEVIIRPSPNNDGVRFPQRARKRSGVVAAVSTTIASGGGQGASSIVLQSATGFARDDIICINPGGADEEYARISKIVGSTAYLDAPLKQAHNMGATITNQAEVFLERADGGSQMEIIVDYGGAATGSDVRVTILAMTYDSDSAT